MKKTLALILALCCAFLAFTACTESDTSDSTTQPGPELSGPVSAAAARKFKTRGDHARTHKVRPDHTH